MVTCNEILKERITTFEIDITSAGEMGCLLEEDRVGAIDLAHVDCYFLGRS